MKDEHKAPEMTGVFKEKAEDFLFFILTFHGLSH